MKQKTAARKYRPATTAMTACGPATLMTSGPSSAKPIANDALRVSVKTPLADSRCSRGTTSGIIAASAGAKKTVTVEMKMFSNSSSAKLSPTSSSAMTANPRRTFVAMRTKRRSTRSTYTPATAENSTAGTRNDRISRLLAVFGWVSDTMTVRPNSTMLPPIWVAAWDSHRRRNAG